MRRILFIISYSIYIVFVLGLVLHTSAHPQLFHKYTIKYVIMLIGLLVLFPIYLWIMWYIFRDSTIIFKKKKYRITSVVKFIIFIVLIILFIVTPAEIYLRHKYQNYESTHYLFTINDFNPFLQRQTVANNSALHIDNYAFRGDTISQKKSEKTFRIFVLGGSTVYNSAIPYEKTFAKILQDKLQKNYPDKKIEVLNAGMDGYTTEHSLIQYLFKIKDFQPDLIIMWHGINDWYYSCSPSTLADQPYQPDYSHFLGADSVMVYKNFSQQPVVYIHLVSLDFFNKFLKDNWYSDFSDLQKHLHPYQGIYTDKTTNMTFDMKTYNSLASYKRNIQSLINATKDDHVQLLLGDQPYLYSHSMTQEEISKLGFPLQCTNANGKYPSLNSMINALNTYNNTMQDTAQRNNVSYVDLASQMPRTLEYFTDDVHYTEKGNQKIAEILYKKIIENDFIQ